MKIEPMKAIETHYLGYRFRSRLEARWAVFLNHLDIKFQYEPQGYTHDGVCYLPDFYLLDQDYWLEVKPDLPDEDAQTKAAMLAEHTGKPVFIMYGDIPTGSEWGNDSAHITCRDSGGGVWSDTGYRWTECGACGFIGMAWGGLSGRLSCPSDCLGSTRGGSGTEKLMKAYEAARGARFEFGDRFQRR